MTTFELEQLYDQIALEDPQFLGGPEKGEKGGDRSDFLKKVWELKNVVRGGKKAGTAVSIQDLKGMAAGLSDTLVAKQVVATQMGLADALPKETVIDLWVKFETRAIACLKAHDAAWFDAFVAEINTAIRKRNAEIAAAKASATSTK